MTCSAAAAGAGVEANSARDGPRAVGAGGLRRGDAAHGAHGAPADGPRPLCLAGGVALNCVGNGRLLREGPFEEIWIQPAAGDAGGALGVAQLIHHRHLGHGRTVTPGRDQMRGSYLGPAFTPEQIQAYLDSVGAVYQRVSDPELFDAVAAPREERIVGWFDGRMEFGPRSLGARSILAIRAARACRRR